MTDVNELNRLIAARDDAAIAALEALDDYCVVDGANVTPAAAAIRSGNQAALEVIAGSMPALEFFPPLGKEAKRLISMQASHVSFDDIAETEVYIGRSAGNEDNWERTPLLEACRQGNRDAIRLLVDAGAKLNAKDALQETALGLCLYYGRELAEFFIDCSAAAKKPFPVEDYILADHAGDADLYAKLVEHGRLTKKASHLAFCLACALLDVDEVTRQLDAGYKLNDKRPFGYDPLLELATSKMLADHGHPDAKTLARGHIRTQEPGEPIALSSTPSEDLAAALDALPPSDVEIDDDDAEWLEMVESGLPGDIDPVLVSDDELEKRLAAIDLLLERGLDASIGNPRDELMFLSSVVETNEPRLLAKLVDAGVEFERAELKTGDPVQSAIQQRCFRMVEPLVALGSKIPKVESHWLTPYRQYLAWRETEGKPAPRRAKPAPRKGPETLPKDASFLPGQKAIRQSAASWELAGESMLAAVLLDGKTVRLTYSNIYCPIDGIELKLRLADITERTREFADVDDWLATALVEELVDDDGELLLRADVEEIGGEQPWFATYEADLEVPDGKSRIEIAVRSPAEGFEEPIVLNDWRVKRL